MRSRLRVIVTLSAMLGGFVAGTGTADAACATTAVANDWSTNCTTYWNANKVSRYTAAIQYILIYHGYYSGSVDGDYGPATQSAVLNYQVAHGLSADGIVGANTWKSLRARLVSQRASTCSGQVTWLVDNVVGTFRRNTTTNVYNLLQVGQSANTCTNHYTMSTAAP